MLLILFILKRHAEEGAAGKKITKEGILHKSNTTYGYNLTKI